MSYNTSIRTNLAQNQEDFKLDLNTQPNIFKYGYFIKELDAIQKDPTQPRTVTVICNQKNCR
jgi:hypothetical protein